MREEGFYNGCSEVVREEQRKAVRQRGRKKPRAKNRSLCKGFAHSLTQNDVLSESHAFRETYDCPLQKQSRTNGCPFRVTFS